MEILICQSCGAILRSQSKSCKSCGALATRHTTTALTRVADASGGPLAVLLQDDPLVLERTVNHIIYGKRNGNGNGDGPFSDSAGVSELAGDGASALYGVGDIVAAVRAGQGNGDSQGADSGNGDSADYAGTGVAGVSEKAPAETAHQLNAAGPTASAARTDETTDEASAAGQGETAPAETVFSQGESSADEMGEQNTSDSAPVASGSADAGSEFLRVIPGRPYGNFGRRMSAPSLAAASVMAMRASMLKPQVLPAEEEAQQSAPDTQGQDRQAEPPESGAASASVSDPPAEPVDAESSTEFANAQSVAARQETGIFPAENAGRAENGRAESDENVQNAGATAGVPDLMPKNSQIARTDEPVDLTATMVSVLDHRTADQPATNAPGLETVCASDNSVAAVAENNSRSDNSVLPARQPANVKAQKPGEMDFFSASPVWQQRQENESGAPAAWAEYPENSESRAGNLTLKPAGESGMENSNGEKRSDRVESKRALAQAEKKDAAGKISQPKSLPVTGDQGGVPGDNEQEDDDEDSEDDEAEEDDGEKDDGEKKRDGDKDRPPRRFGNDRFQNKNKEPEKTVEIMGRSFSRNTLITTGILAVVIGFPFMVLLSCVVSIISGAQGGGQATAPGTAPVAQSVGTGQLAGQLAGQSVVQPAGAGQAGYAVPTGPPTSMTGRWSLEYENVGTTVHGRGAFDLTQNGDRLEGYGRDNSGEFQLGGTLSGDIVRFNKVYSQAGKPAGKPITYAGKVTVSQNVMQMLGKWELTKRQGYGWRAQIVTLGGQFGARLVEPGASAAGPRGGVVAQPAGSVAAPGPAAPHDPKHEQNFFMQVALGIIGFGVVMAMVSLRFFGPSGLLNIWAKKEYIPSQFKSQHFKMVKEMGKRVTTGGLPLGARVDWGIHQFWLPRQLAMPAAMREKNPHMFMIGAGATGKTRLMASMIAQDIESNDRAVVLVDSDGGLADLILNWIASRPNGADIAKRVIIVDPTYRGGQPLGYNPLEFPEDEDLQNAASSLVFGFKAAYTEPPGAQSQWNQQTANILRNSSILLMANNKTLTDLPVLLSDNDFRDVLLERIEQTKNTRSEFITLIDAWTNYKRLARTDQWITWIEPILNRVQPMLSDPRIRAILTKEKSELDLKKVISERKVLIVRIPQGQLEKNGNLLGSLMVAGLKQSALSLCARSQHKRRPCALYLDEFESFIEKETFDAITTETRKLQIGFCGASKTLQILPEDFRSKIIINCGVMAIFALAKKDADMLGPQMFRVDGRKIKHQTINNVFNKVNTSPQFELIMDEEKLNIDRVVGQEKQTYFCYRVGSVAGVFCLKAPDFKNIDPAHINKDLIDLMHQNRQFGSADAEDEDVDDDDSEEEDEEDEEEE